MAYSTYSLCPWASIGHTLAYREPFSDAGPTKLGPLASTIGLVVLQARRQ
jgi:hypothetical protein